MIPVEWIIIGAFSLFALISVVIVIDAILAPDPPRPNKDDLVILQILSDNPSYGYLIRKRYRDITGTSLSTASIYDALHYLLEEDFIKRSTQNLIINNIERKTYEATGKGRGALKEAHLVLE